MKDTKYEDLNKTLAAVGKAVFVNFYYDFKDFSISKDELAKKILSENPGSKSDSQNSRIPRARHIFESGQEKEAFPSADITPEQQPHGLGFYFLPVSNIIFCLFNFRVDTVIVSKSEFS